MRLAAAIAAIMLIGAAKPHARVTPPPLVRVDSPPPAIQTVTERPSWTFGSWQTSDEGSYTIASTINDSGSAFGAVCGKTCVWFVNFRSECDEGKDYPAMINGPGGSYAVQLRCYHLDKYRLLTFEMTDDSLNILTKGGEVGFAFPFLSGKFGVSRFSLDGGQSAVAKAIDLAVAKHGQEGLKDFTI